MSYADEKLAECNYKKDDILNMMAYRKDTRVKGSYFQRTYVIFDEPNQKVRIQTFDTDCMHQLSDLSLADIDAVRSKCVELGWNNEL